MERSLGWNTQRLATRSGFTMDSAGLDKAVRGGKMEFDRYDWIIIDDIDDTKDSIETILKNETTLSQDILPAIAENADIMAIQNLLKPGSVFHRLYEKTSDLLSDRIVSGPWKALEDVKTGKDSEGKTIIIDGMADLARL